MEKIIKNLMKNKEESIKEIEEILKCDGGMNENESIMDLEIHEDYGEGLYLQGYIEALNDVLSKLKD